MLEKKTYLISRATGALSNALYGLVFIWWLQIQTSKSSLVGLTNAIFSITAALSIFYGPIIDNHPFKKTSIWALVIQTLLLFLLTGIIFYLSKNIFLAILVAGLLSICDEFFNPADRAILKETVTNEKSLTNLISKISIIDQFVNIAGTALSGAMLGFMASGQVMLACSCLSLLSVLILVFALRKVPATKPNYAELDKENTNYIRQIFSGFKFIQHNNFLNHYFWSSTLYSFASPALLILLPKVAQKFGSATYYSGFYVCFIVGFLLGATFSGKLLPKVKIIANAWVISAIPLALMIFFISNWLIFGILIIFFGFATSIHEILAESMIQIKSDDAHLGRILTTIRTSASIGGPISSILCGIILDRIGGESLVITVSAILVLISGCNMFFSKD